MPARRDYRMATSPLDRDADGVELQAKRVYFLSVEGERTEVDYFRHLSVFLQREYPHFPFVIHVLRHRKDGLSSPGQVRGLLDECAELRMGSLAHHGKSISHPVFKARYARNLTKAISHSTAFPDDFKSLLKSIGTNLGGLAAEWLEGTRT